MYSDVLNKILFQFPATKDTYAGTFALDKLPRKVKYPSSMIINNQKSTEPGAHWVAVYFDSKKHAFFFDSYAQSAKSYNLESYLIKHSLKLIENKKQLQGFSSYCGYYCVLFIIFTSLGYLKEFLNFFKSPLKNDYLIEKLIKEN